MHSCHARTDASAQPLRLKRSFQCAAYDFFPCQYQLWYRTRGKAMWYDPIFKVITLDGRETWRRRHYKVRRADVPGTFFFSVLDNGVTSKCALAAGVRCTVACALGTCHGAHTPSCSGLENIARLYMCVTQNGCTPPHGQPLRYSALKHITHLYVRYATNMQS